jgi:hypothetical protein
VLLLATGSETWLGWPRDADRPRQGLFFQCSRDEKLANGIHLDSIQIAAMGLTGRRHYP